MKRWQCAVRWIVVFLLFLAILHVIELGPGVSLWLKVPTVITLFLFFMYNLMQALEHCSGEKEIKGPIMRPSPYTEDMRLRKELMARLAEKEKMEEDES